MPTGKRFVFIGGLHRSGTSLLHEILKAHPDVSGFSNTGVWEDEGQHLQSVYLPSSAHGTVGRFGFDDKAHLTEESPLAVPRSASLLWEQWSQYWDVSRPVLIEKSPPNLIRSRFLQALFPGAQFLMIMRHPVVTTLATQKWAKKQAPGSLLRHWFVCHEFMRADVRQLRSVHFVFYEALRSDPERVLAEVATFLDLSGTLDHSRVDVRYDQKYHEMWAAMNRGVRGPYTRHLVRRFEGQSRQFGYSMTDLNAVEESVSKRWMD